MDQEKKKIIVHGYFVAVNTPRTINHSITWEFVEENEVFMLTCPFEPICNFVQYKLLITSGKFNTVIEVLDTKQRPICHDVVFAWEMAYDETKTVDQYIDQLKKQPKPIQRLFLQWYYWDEIRYLQSIYNVSQMDDFFVQYMLQRLMDNEPYVDHFLPWSLIPEMLPPDVREEYTFIEEMKRVMKRYCTWTVDGNQLTGLQYTYYRTNNATRAELIKKGTLTMKPGRLSLTPRACIPLRPDVPVDYSIERGQCWSIGEHQVNEREITWVMHGQPKLGKRVICPTSLKYDQLVAILVNDFKTRRIFFVFPDFDASKGFYHHLQLKHGMYQTVQDRKASTEIFFAQGENGMYHVWKGRNEKVDTLTFDRFHARYRSFQTGVLRDIQYIYPGLFDTVVFFGTPSVPRRFLQWCDRCCGSETTLCLIGSPGVYF